ncbi:MAG: uridine kinase [Janthinobacterium lividum]
MLLIALVIPTPLANWYAPFMQASVTSLDLDPWSHWIQSGGTAAAFPYGYVMWLFFLPGTLISKLIGIDVSHAYGLSLLLADLALLTFLRKIHSVRGSTFLWSYWLSPIVIIASYLLGYNDLVPVLFLVFSLYCTRKGRMLWSGLFFVAALSAKLSMVLALPFYFVYFYHNRSVRQLAGYFIKGLGIGFLLFLLPFLWSKEGIYMLFKNPEMGKVYAWSFNVGALQTLYLIPLVYTFILYAAWRVRRLNFALFEAMLGTAFLLVVLATSAPPGWFIWVLPFLCAFQLRTDRTGIFLASLFSALYVLGLLVEPTYFPGMAAVFSARDIGFVASLVHTSEVAIGIILTVRMWRETVKRNDFFRLSRKPFVIGVSGDSGAGKDTFVNAIGGLFGSHSVSTLSGDDYHLWDRQKPMWQVMTHLNPVANDLERFSSDLLRLTDGKSIHARHYDHATGKMSKPHRLDSNDIIIASGLHALYLPILRQCYNLSVYLDIDEDLRRYLKIKRDVRERGHSMERVLASFEKREADSKRFIRSQEKYADLVLSLQPIHPKVLTDVSDDRPLRFKLVARSRSGLNELAMTRVLIGVCGIHIDMTVSEDGSEVTLMLEGETCADDIALAARMICPGVMDFLDIEPVWRDGAMGLMQLITLSHINQSLRKRFIW